MFDFFLDLPNLIGVLIFILFFYLLKSIPSWVALLLSLSAFFPYFLNDFLFSASYMPDQFKYYEVVKSLRSFNLDYVNRSNTIEVSGWILSFVPLPFVETIKSLGFFNRFIFTSLVLWLYVSKKMRGFPIVFLLIYPSLILYTSLSLRETIITFFMIVSMIYLIDGKSFRFFLFSIPLFFLKFQNFFLLLVFLFIFLLRKEGTFFYRFRFLLCLLVLFLFAPFVNQVIEVVDYYRYAMFVEDGNDVGAYVNISGLLDFFILGLKSAPYFIFKPLPWEVNGGFQVIQSFENIVVVVVVLFFFYFSFKKDRYITVTWLLYFLFSMTIYGLVVFNFGTAARYRFTFFVFVVVGLSYELFKKYGAKVNLSVGKENS